MLVPREVLDRSIAQHRLAWGKLIGELHVAYDETLASWAKKCPDPMMIPGGTLCSDVRTRVLLMNGLHAQSRVGESHKLKGSSCGRGSTLIMTMGPNASVRLGDVGEVWWSRVRHMSPKRAGEIGALTPQPLPDPRPGKQLAFDAAEMESEPQVMGPVGIGDQYELVVYWWESPGRLSVAGAILAMVVDIDTTDEQIVDFVAMPAAVMPTAPPEEVGDEDLRDFEPYLPERPADTGDAGA